jgi:adenylate cyclase
MQRRTILDDLIASHRGRIANTAGDSVLAEFGSTVDAVQCAVQAQAALASANSSVAPDRHINFRIGIHIGDVMVRAGDLFGDGVNVAARLQTVAAPGGVCISRMTYDQIRKILPLEFVDLGERQVKNIEEPVRVYSVGPNSRPAATADAPRSVISDTVALPPAARQTVDCSAAVSEHVRRHRPCARAGGHSRRAYDRSVSCPGT